MKSKIIPVLAVVTLAFAPIAKKVELNFELQGGKTYSQTTTANTVTTQTIGGIDQVIKSNTSATTNLELKKEGADGDTYSLWYENIQLALDMAGQKQAFNSDTTALDMANPTSLLLMGLTDKKFDARISRKGKIEEVMGLEEIITAATSKAEGEAAMVAEQLSGGFGDTGLARNLEMVTDVFPSDPVKVGDTWTKEQATATGLPLIATNTYTLKSLDGNKATITVNGKLKTDTENAAAEIQGMEVTYFVEGDRTGNIVLDQETGWVINANFVDNILGSLTLAPNAQLPDGMIIPLKLKSEIAVNAK